MNPSPRIGREPDLTPELPWEIRLRYDELAAEGLFIEKYLWEGVNTKLLAVYNPDDTLKIRFRYADDRVPVSMTYQGATYYLLTDQVGTVRAVANASGTIVKRLDYDAFGNVLSDSAPSFPMPLGFAGGMQDKDAGLVRFGARDYEPAAGRWVAKDPIDFDALDSNVYGYVGGDPTNFVDPFGLAACPPAPGFGSCWTSCMQQYGANIALAALGVASPAMTIPKPFGAGILGAGPWTNALSIANVGLKAFFGYGGKTLRILGQKLNPVSNVVAAGAAGYLVGLSGNCAFMCTFQTP